MKLVLVFQVLSVASLVLLTILAGFCLKLRRQVEAEQLKNRQLEEKVDHLARAQLGLQDGMHELRTGTLGVGNKVKELVEEMQQTRAKQDELENADPGSRHYAQAAKLVEQGYSIEELMRECELPRAEAELLFNLHRR